MIIIDYDAYESTQILGIKIRQVMYRGAVWPLILNDAKIV